ncbi:MULTISPECIES: hypothetical protein [Paenibacillus]|uniref:hypothetical protein n=1 Tax=Paenibacillus TaxID=44249 RepID=UPI00096E5825|nr:MULTISPECIES: hypothetical protein [Paenibacillus]OMD20184.1 hypothetical protein BJP48_10695 [Paenibacillus odorifer]OME07032.1 hypothetical protein BSK60_32130 [Paenibacillus odorifer]OMF84633.1 hypothetical protein BK147_32995 [Paenibacillus sp. FSL R7-0337]
MFNLFSGQSKDQKEYLKELAFYKEARELLKKTLIENLNLKDMYGDPFMMIVHSHKGKQYDGIKTEKKTDCVICKTNMGGEAPASVMDDVKKELEAKGHKVTYPEVRAISDTELQFWINVK